MSQQICRGVRGATTCTENSKEAIIATTRELLEQIIGANDINMEDVASIFFTATPDLNATFPALAAREMGWNRTALLCAQEIAVPDGMPGILRILIHWNTDKNLADIQHMYINGAEKLRPDFASTVKPPILEE